MHYDPQQEIGFSDDASAYGFGAELVRTDVSGNERHVYYASKVLLSLETYYYQIEKKGLAIVFELKYF